MLPEWESLLDTKWKRLIKNDWETMPRLNKSMHKIIQRETRRSTGTIYWNLFSRLEVALCNAADDLGLDDPTEDQLLVLLATVTVL